MANRAWDWFNQAVRDWGRAPFEHYGPLQSEEAIRYAREILEFVRSQMA